MIQPSVQINIETAIAIIKANIDTLSGKQLEELDMLLFSEVQARGVLE